MNNKIKIISRNKVHVTFLYKEELHSFFFLGKNFGESESNGEAFRELKIQYPELLL